VNGVFTQLPTHSFIALRRERLDERRSYTYPLTTGSAKAEDPDGLAAAVSDRVKEHGLGLVQLDRPMTNDEYRDFGARLGTPQKERSPDVQPFVEEGVILNVVARTASTADPARQPFAANSLALHSESSGAAVDVQPRLIVLMCLSTGYSPITGQTVAVAMRDVFDALSTRDRELLATTSYDHPGCPPSLLRLSAGHPVFSVRDFQATPMPWVHRGPAKRPEEIDDALARLYTAMYSQPFLGVEWRPGLLVVIDNMRHFHGRTAASAPTHGQMRHLKRLRIGVSEARK
jgi:Taurine catabolism dioxygenase TauD, TfdA family